MQLMPKFFLYWCGRLVCLVCLFFSHTLANAGELTLEEATNIALSQTARGRIIEGKRDVAEQNYRARRINFLVPEISINGSLPSYSVDESFRFFGGATQKKLYKTRDVSFNSFVELKQSLLTGGNLTITANLVADDSRYPDTRSASLDASVDEVRRQGFFNFSLEQPLFRPSTTKKDLHDRRDDMELARMTEIEESAALRREVADAYVGLLVLDLKHQLQGDKLKSARLKMAIDSSKFQDGVVSEEALLESASGLLDAELESVDVETEAREQKRELASLLGLEPTEEITAIEPVIKDHYDSTTRQVLLSNWESTVAIRKAEHEYEKSLRSANFAAAGHGVTGDLKANYSLGRGNIETESGAGNTDDDIDTRGWGVSLNVRVPVWDGGAGGAAVKAARFGAEQARLELDKARKDAHSEIVRLFNDLDVGYRRLDVIKRQIELARNRLKIAETRFADGQISEIQFLDSRIFYREQENRYLGELRLYLLNRIELSGKFITL